MKLKQIAVAVVVVAILGGSAIRVYAWWNCWAPGVCDWIDE